MTGQGSDGVREIKLHCYHGRAAPDLVVDGWRKLSAFPAAARAHFWELLGPALLTPANPSHGQRIEAFGKAHALAREDVAAALRSCQLLLRQSCGLDLSAEQFKEDLVALSSGRSEAADMLSAQYPDIKTELREQILQQTLADHGKVMVGIDWRLDQVTASQHGDRLDAQVVFLSLRYREAERLERMTIQLTPKALQHLKRFCDKFVS